MNAYRLNFTFLIVMVGLVTPPHDSCATPTTDGYVRMTNGNVNLPPGYSSVTRTGPSGQSATATAQLNLTVTNTSVSFAYSGDASVEPGTGGEPYVYLYMGIDPTELASFSFADQVRCSGKVSIRSVHQPLNYGVAWVQAGIYRLGDAFNWIDIRLPEWLSQTSTYDADVTNSFSVILPPGTYVVFANPGLIAWTQVGANYEAVTTAGVVKYDITFAAISSVDIAALSLTWNSSIGGIDFAYTVSGGSLARSTTARLFWANGSNIASVISPTPIYTVDIPAGFSGLATNHMFGSFLHTPPTNATHVLLALDTDNLIAESNETNNTLALRPQSLEISAFTIGWDTNSFGGLHFSYFIDGGSLPNSTTAKLFWSSGTNVADIFSAPPIFTNAIPLGFSGSSGIVSVPRSYLETEPSGATHIFLVVDPDRLIWGAIETNSTLPLLNVQFGIDVSHRQNDAGTINWNAVTNAGKRFVFVKATDGYRTSQSSPMITDFEFTNNMSAATSVGLLAGAYHFARPYINAATNEAALFLSVAGNYIGSGYLPPVLDIEDPSDDPPHNQVSTMPPDTLSAWIRTWLQFVEEQTCVRPIIYTTRGILRDRIAPSIAAMYPLWIATSGTTFGGTDIESTPTLGGTSWPDWQFKQYQNEGNGGACPGITGKADLNSFRGDFRALLELSNHSNNPRFTGVGGGVIQPPRQGQFQLEISICGQQQITQIKVQASADLVTWIDVATLSVSGGKTTFTDTNALGQAKFYRLKL